MNNRQYISILVILLYSSACKQKETNEHSIMLSEIKSEAYNVFDYWYPHMIDFLDGGYFTNAEHDWQQNLENKEKMLVTQARNLWASSFAFQYYPNNKSFLEAAHQGYRFLTEKMWHPKKGGFIINFPFNADQPPKYTLIYGNAFALYALSEYYKIAPNKPEVEAWIMKTFFWIDRRGRRAGEDGYYNIVFYDEYDMESQKFKNLVDSIGWGNPEWKDQNTTIHLMEAFSNTNKVLNIPRIKERLEEMLFVVRDYMTDEDGSLRLNFNKDWTPVSYQDSTREFILEHILYDHISFGHNIETAYLLIDASKSLYGEVDERTLLAAKKMIDHTVEYGFDQEYYGVFDKGYQFNENATIEIVNNRKVWWAQAEALHSLLLFHSHFPQEPKYWEAAKAMWQYIRDNLIDHEYGGWYPVGLDSDPQAKNAPKASVWKGPYHNGRALQLSIDYLSE